MFSINPIYAMIAGGVLALGAAGTIKYQSDQIHKYHTRLNCVEHGECPKGYEKLTTVPQLKNEIVLLKTAQTGQTKTTANNVAKVVTPKPEIITVVKKFKEAPLPPNCETPDVPAELEQYL